MTSPQVVAPNVVEQVRERAGGYGLVMRAENIRPQRTGLHAKLTVWAIREGEDKRLFLAGTICNIERDEDRTKLLNTARRQGGDKVEFVLGPPEEQATLKKAFDLFCFSVWDTLMATQDAEMVVGDAMLPLGFRAKPHVIQGGGTIWFGPPGGLKSTTALIMAVAVDAGVNGIWETEKCPVLFVNLERSPESLKRRLGQVNDALGLAPDRPLAMLNARGRSLIDAQHSIEREVERRATKFIVVDSITRMGAGDLVSNEVANASMDLLNALCPTWLAIGHTPRADSTHLFGSQMYDAAADVMVKVTAAEEGRAHGVRLEVTKVNDFKRPKPMTLKLTFDEFGLHGIGSAKAGEFTTLEPKTDKNTIVNYLAEQSQLGKATATQIAGAVGMNRATVSRILNGGEEFIEVEQIGREVFYGVRSDLT